MTDRTIQLATELTKAAIEHSGETITVPERAAKFLEAIAQKIEELYTRR